jgi:hypothetical protein
MTQITEMEMLAINVAGDEGCACNGAETAEELKDDNMTWFTAKDLMRELGWNGQQAGAIMASLQEKGLASDSGEAMVDGMSTTKAGYTDWTLTDAGIDAYFDNL